MFQRRSTLKDDAVKFEKEYEYPGDLQAVWQMLGDPEFVRLRSEQARFDSTEVDIQADDTQIQQNVTVQLDSERIAEKIPAAAKKFVPDTITISFQESWQKNEDAGEAEPQAAGTFEVTPKGAPVKVTGNSVLTQTAENTTVRKFSGDLTVSIPLVGKTMEAKLLEHIDKIIDADKEASTDWFAAQQ